MFDWKFIRTFCWWKYILVKFDTIFNVQLFGWLNNKGFKRHTWNYVQGCRGKNNIQQEDYFTSRLVKFEEETSKLLHFEHIFVWSWNLDTSENRSEVLGKLRNVVLERMGKIIWTDSVKNELLLRVKGGEAYRTYSKKERRLTGLITSCVGTAF